MVVRPMRNGTEDEDEGYTSMARVWMTCGLSLIQALVFVIILCPMAVLFVFGMYISAGFGLWRLVEHDFSNDAAEAAGANHLKPALQVLYSLAVTQGVLFGYKSIHAWGAKVGLAEFVAGRYLLQEEDKELVADYLEHIVAGCEKDPSFTNGRNLVTYSVDLITDAKSDGSFFAGVRLLGAATRHEQEMLAQQLLTRSASSLIRMTQRLLETLDPRRHPEDSATTRQSAGKIAALVAGTVFLEQCPGMIQCISSQLDRFEECITVPPKDYEQEWRITLAGLRRHDFLPVQQCLTVLQNLAYREDNCRGIISTEGLLLRATAPLTAHHLFYENSHRTWYNMADESLRLMCRLAMVPGETGTKLRSEISRSQKAIISTLETTLECPKCNFLLKRRVLETLLDLCIDTTPIMARGGITSRIFTWILLFTFVSTKDCFRGIGFSIRRMKRRIHITRVAGEMLSSNQELSAMLSLQRQSYDDQGRARTMLQSVSVLLGDLTTALVDVGNISINVPAAKFLNDLCDNFGVHDKYRKELQNAVVRVMPEVLRELLSYMLTREETQVVAQENNIPASSEDIESGGVSQDFAKETPSSSHQQMGEKPEDTPEREALLTSLCKTVKSTWYRSDPDLARQLDEVAIKVGSEQGKDVNKFSDIPFLPIWRKNLVIS